MSRNLAEFLVRSVPEEYFIISRMCCPKCKAPELKVVLQELLILTEIPSTLKNSGASDMTDRLTLKCKKCGSEFTLIFYLHKSYTEKLSTVAEELMKTLERNNTQQD